MSSPDASPDIEALFAQTLLSDYDDDAPWQAVTRLNMIGTQEVFDRAARWLLSVNWNERARGADVLSQLDSGRDPKRFSVHSYPLIETLLKTETEPHVVASSIRALGWFHNPDSIDLIIKFFDNEEIVVRSAVAGALGWFADDPRSIDVLLQLMRDRDDGVREVAAFNLGIQGSGDSVAIRTAFVEQLSDSYEYVRLDAIASLAKRKDRRVLNALLKELDTSALSESQPSCFLIEAAYQMLDLENEQEGWDESDYASALRERYSI
jgi:HEAT repeat protein